MVCIAARAAATGLALLVISGPVAGQTASGASLMTDLSVLAADSMAGRAVGTDGGRMAREYLAGRLAEIGLEVTRDTFEFGRGEDTVAGVNLRSEIVGSTHPEAAIVLTAHYDHLGVRDGTIYNGTDDNASGSAGLLALAEWFIDHPPRHTVHVVFTDAEEGGLRGARAFVADPPIALDRIVLNINLDMIAHADTDLWVAGTYPWPELKGIVERADPVAPVVLRFGHDTPADQGADNWILASDHGPFHERGIPFLYFGVADHADYHQPTDDLDTIDPGFFSAAVETIRRVVESADQSLGGRRAGN
jgi:Zn-dependent M28 family amino/carboxypeptidase